MPPEAPARCRAHPWARLCYPLGLLSTNEFAVCVWGGTPFAPTASFVLEANLAGTDGQGFLRYSPKLSSERSATGSNPVFRRRRGPRARHCFSTPDRASIQGSD